MTAPAEVSEDWKVESNALRTLRRGLRLVKEVCSILLKTRKLAERLDGPAP